MSQSVGRSVSHTANYSLQHFVLAQLSTVKPLLSGPLINRHLLPDTIFGRTKLISCSQSSVHASQRQPHSYASPILFVVALWLAFSIMHCNGRMPCPSCFSLLFHLCIYYAKMGEAWNKARSEVLDLCKHCIEHCNHMQFLGQSAPSGFTPSVCMLT